MSIKANAVPAQIHREPLYNYDDLDDSTKEDVRQYVRTHWFDYDWDEFVIEDSKECAKLIGIDIDNVWYSGFWSQGDGACFEGEYAYRKGAAKAIRDHAPLDTELHRIADELQKLQRAHFYGLSARVSHSGFYSHEYCTRISVFDRDDDADVDTDESLCDLLRDYMRWIYKRLEQEYEWLTADEQIDNMLRDNEYTFTEEGEIS